MKNIYEVVEPLRAAIVVLDDLQKQIAKIPSSDVKKENLLKEIITLNISGSENSLIGANMIMVNADTIDEAVLWVAIDSTKAMLNKLKK